MWALAYCASTAVLVCVYSHDRGTERTGGWEGKGPGRSLRFSIEESNGYTTRTMVFLHPHDDDATIHTDAFRALSGSSIGSSTLPVLHKRPPSPRD